MRKNIYLKILAGVFIFVLLVKISIALIFKLWIGHVLRQSWNNQGSIITITPAHIHALIFSSGVELQSVVISTRANVSKSCLATGEIKSVRLTGLNPFAYLFHHRISLGEVNVT